jgi:3-oxo-5-alpha-steroid 4-dehydrogenase 1
MLTLLFSNLEEEQVFHHRLCMGMLYISPLVFLFLRYVFPPNWGKTYRTLLGPTVPPRIAWCLFEIPNLFWAALCYCCRTDRRRIGFLPTPNMILLMLFVGHYINRAIVYPLTLNPHTKRLPLEIVLAAHLYTNINGYIQAQALCQFETFPDDTLRHPQFWLGMIIFGIGVAINWQSDDILRNLRKTTPISTKQQQQQQQQQIQEAGGATIAKKSHYVIPNGGFFRYVSAPHYMGEILEWTGFAVAAQFSWASLSFAVFTCANLIPRAVAHHQWYLVNFKDYPRERTAVVPFLW